MTALVGHVRLGHVGQPGRSVRLYLSPSTYLKAIPYDDGTIDLAVVVDGVQVAVIGSAEA